MNHFLKKTLAVVCGVSLFLGAFAGCTTQTPGGITEGRIIPVDGGVLKLCSVYPDTLNPLKTKSKQNYDMLMLIYEGLFKKTPEHQIKPVLAEDYTVSDDGTSYRVALKSGIKFHDGTPFGARDVVETLNNMDQYCPAYAPLFQNIKRYYPSGDTAVVFELIQPEVNFAARLTFPILPADTDTEVFKNDTTSFFPVGTGQYVYKEKLRQKTLTLTKNEGWHGGNLYISNIEVSFLKDNAAARYAFNICETDMITSEVFRYGEFTFSTPHRIVEYTNDICVYLGVNQTNAALADPIVRQALSAAIDRGFIANDILYGHCRAVQVPVNPDAYFYPENTAPVYDANAARGLLGRGGWVDLDTDGVLDKPDKDAWISLRFSLLFDSADKTAGAVAAYVAQTAANSGIQIEVEALSSSALQKRVAEGDYDIYLGKQTLPASYDLSAWPGQMDKGLQDAILKTAQCTEETAVMEGFLEVCELFLEQMPNIPLYFETNTLLYQDYLKGTVTPTVDWSYQGVENLFIEEQ